MGSVAELGKLIFVAVASAIVTSYLAFHEFRAQRWWEQKVDAYNRIIDALWQMLDYYGQNSDHFLGIRELSDRKQKELARRLDLGRQEVMKAGDIGAFLISERAATALKKMWKDAESRADPNDVFTFMDDAYGAVKACLDEVKAAAQEDLRVGRPWHLLWRR